MTSVVTGVRQYQDNNNAPGLARMCTPPGAAAGLRAGLDILVNDIFGGDAYMESEKKLNWRDATAREPHFCISEPPRVRCQGHRALAADPEAARYAGKA
jgi:hypothetical protein